LLSKILITMKKSFLAPAVGACLALCAAAASAQTQVTIYGIAAIEALHATNVVTPGTPGTGSQTKLDNSPVWSSRLGFRGSEDLGGGVSAIFDMTHGFALDSGADASKTFWNRGSWVGLSSRLGTLTAGRHWNINDDIMGRYFIFGGYSAFRFSEFGFLSDLVNNSVKYVSPKFGGLQVRALYGFGEGETGYTAEVGANYEAGPVSVGATYRNAKDLAGKTDKLASLGASYALGSVRLHAGWSDSDSQALNLPKARAYDFGAVWNVGAWSWTVDYVARDQRDTNNDSHFVRLQGDYFLSKGTVLFGNLVGLSNDGTANQRFFGAGGAGLSQNVVSLGIRHLF
jgi:general bacterial porin, GBP family